MRRGVFFSLDALLALLIAFALMTSTFAIITAAPRGNAIGNAPLEISQDALLAMEKGGVLGIAVKNSDPAPIRKFAEIIPNNICYRISIMKPPSGDAIIAEENCRCIDYSVARRSIVVGSASSEEYLAEMRACNK
ncbi:MAG: hypothetical protein V1835_05650 [Candidatus Micrarchaeota archaeon]